MFELVAVPATVLRTAARFLLEYHWRINMVAIADAVRDRTRIIGRHDITFPDSKYAEFQKSVSKTRRKNFSMSRILALLGKSG